MEADDVFAEAVMRRNGIPRDLALSLRGITRAFRAWGSGATVDVALRDGAELRLRLPDAAGASPARALAVGHDLPRRGLRRAARGRPPARAHLLEPARDAPLEGGAPEDRPRALEIYLASLRATQGMDGVRVVLPGHGDEVTDHVALIDERFAMHERRAAKLAGLIAERPSTAFELAQALWGNVAVTQAYLALSEVLGHLDLLVDRRIVREALDRGVVRFIAA